MLGICNCAVSPCLGVSGTLHSPNIYALENQSGCVSDAAAIYKYKQILAREISNIEKDRVNGKIILKYYRSRVAEGLSLARILKCVSTLKLISRRLKKPFTEARKEDIVDLIANIEERDISPWTKHDYKVILKKFYKWLRDSDDPPEVKWIKIPTNIKNSLVKEKLLTPKEINRLAEAATSIRDKALILVLFETGRRIGEILTLKIGDVEFDQYGARLVIDGKTGPDLSRVVASAPKLALWLDNHPLRNDREAPVWIEFGRKRDVHQLTYGAARAMLKDCAKRAELGKRVFFHLFRHSRATHACTLLTQAQMNHMFGWKQGSRMPSVYVHLAGKDLDDALFILNDMKPKPEPTESQFKVNICPRCDAKNSPDSKFCNLCGAIVDAKTAVELDQTRAKVDRLLDKLTEDPERLEKLLKLVEAV